MSCTGCRWTAWRTQTSATLFISRFLELIIISSNYSSGRPRPLCGLNRRLISSVVVAWRHAASIIAMTWLAAAGPMQAYATSFAALETVITQSRKGAYFGVEQIAGATFSQNEARH